MSHRPRRMLVVTLAAVTASAAASADLPPVSDVHRTELDTARDGRDYHEQAFVALVEHAGQWNADEVDHARSKTDALVADAVTDLLADPDAHRGDIVRLDGRLEQTSPIDPAYGEAREWFVRLDDGRPVMVFIAGDNVADSERIGAAVSIVARYYKPIELVGRDGRSRRYPAFVGAHPQLEQAAANAAPGVWRPAVLVVLVIALALLWVIVRRVGARPGRTRTPQTTGEIVNNDDAPDAALPDEPADALAELRRRADATRP